MSDETPITRREFDLTIKNLSLTIAKEVGEMMDGKIQQWQTQWDSTGEERYKERVLELTGETIENVGRIRSGMQYSMKASESSEDTVKTVKTVVIGYGIPLGIGAAITWIATHFNNNSGS